MKPSSEKRLRLLQLVAQSQQRGEFPVAREMAHALGYKGGSSIRRMLNSLVEEGYLKKQGGGPERMQVILSLTDRGQRALPRQAVPQEELPEGGLRLAVPVLGHIPAGPLAEAVQECDEWIDAGDSLRVQSGDFFLRVIGKSMTGDGILPGDLVLIRPGLQINNGDIAAVQIHIARQSEATLKHIHYQAGKKTVRLRASNPAYADTVLPASEVEVVGAYRGLLRRLEPKAKQ